MTRRPSGRPGEGPSPSAPAPSPRNSQSTLLVSGDEMDLNKLTLKSQAALQGAQELARSRNQQLVEPAHVLYALLSDPEGVVFPLLQRLGQSPRVLRDRVEELLDRIPKVY